MKKKVIIAALLLLAGAGWGERILSVNMDVYKNDSVKVNSLKVMEGYTTKYIPSGDYRLDILGAEGGVIQSTPLDPSFILFTDPPIEREYASVVLRVEYRKDMRALKLYKSGKEIYSGTILTCNSDDMCEIGFESYLSCPADCPLDGSDGICTSAGEGLCDPDCAKGVDPDCIRPRETGSCNDDGLCDTHAGETADNCPEDCGSPPAGDCVKEGSSIDTSGSRQCCAGLAAISCAHPGTLGTCPDVLCDSFPCARCPDGSCGPAENACNCPADCSSASTTVAVMGRVTSTTKVSTTSIAAPQTPPTEGYASLLPYAVLIIVALIMAAYLIYKRKNVE